MRPALRWWNKKDEEAINHARRQYDDGLIELFTKRDGDTFILLKKVNDFPVKRRPYFFAPQEKF